MAEETAEVAAQLAATNLESGASGEAQTSAPSAAETSASSGDGGLNQSADALFTLGQGSNPFVFSRAADPAPSSATAPISGFSFLGKSASSSSQGGEGGTPPKQPPVGSGRIATSSGADFPSLPPPPASAGAEFNFNAAVDVDAIPDGAGGSATSYDQQGYNPQQNEYNPKIQAHFTEQKLLQLQDDESSPLFSMTNFEDLGLPEELLRALRSMNFKKPSRIQCATLPHIIKTDQNVIGQSQSGTGKTACFGLGLLSKLDDRLRKPQALVLSPTRELALQITNELRSMARYKTMVNIIACIPGYDFTGGVMAQVVVGTPGRVKDAMDRRYMSSDYLRVLVLDEADAMLETIQGGSGGNATLAMQIKKRCPRDCQILLFSATYPQSVRRFCMAFAPNAKKFSIAEARSLNLAYIKQVIVKLPYGDAKFQFLLDIYGFCDINQSVIFCNSKNSAKSLAENMRAQNFAVALLQADMPPEQRDDVLNSFRNQMTRVLIATNIIARGVDVVQVSVVINYELPMSNDRQTPDFETYLHRIGRCGRFGRPGVAINFACTARESYTVNAIAHHYDVQMREAHTPEDIKTLFDENDQESAVS